jgi:hypothetical protein
MPQNLKKTQIFDEKWSSVAEKPTRKLQMSIFGEVTGIFLLLTLGPFEKFINAKLC